MKRIICKTLPLIAAVVALALWGCKEDKFHIEGELSGDAADLPIVLEKADPNGAWIVMDSTRTDSDGRFSFSREASPAPEIYRLALNGDYIYLPVDSTETVSVKSTSTGFGRDFSLTGSADAESMTRFEKDLARIAPYRNIPDSISNFKRRVFSEYLMDAKGSITSYYILTKTFGDTPLFGDPDDYKYIAAVATAYRQYRPDDPRSAMLESSGVEALKRRNAARGKQRVVEASETGMLEITLPDEQGNTVSLSSRLGNGKRVALVFADMTAEDSPALNMQLRRVFDSGTDIYMVSFDADRYAWRRAAANLPWITVYAGDVTAARKVISDYNVAQLPAFFIYDAAGNLTSRVQDVKNL